MLTCVNCHAPLGVEAGELPFGVSEDDGSGVGRMEHWCPQCFVHHRAPLEPERFQPHRPELHASGYRAIKCCNPRCGLVSVDTGRGVCGQCNGHVTIELMPKPGSGALGWKEDVLATAGLVAKKKT